MFRVVLVTPNRGMSDCAGMAVSRPKQAGNCTLKEQELEDRDRREAQDGGDENALRGKCRVYLVLLREQDRVCGDRHRDQEHGDREQELIRDKGGEHEERHDREDDEPQRGHEVHPPVAGQSL